MVTYCFCQEQWSYNPLCEWPDATTKSDGTTLTPSNFRIGATPAASGTQYYFDGYIDDIRVTKGVARYSSSFTPPTSALSADVSDITGSDDVVLLLDGTSVNDGSTGGLNDATLNGDASANDTTVTDPYGGSTGSYEFDGTGDTLTIPNSTDFDFGSGDWTIECWAYHIGQMPANAGLFGKRAGGAIAPFTVVGENNTDATKALRFYGSTNGTFNIVIVPTTDFPLDQWVHLAVTRAGNVYTMWQNGVDIGSTTVSGSLMTNTDPVVIGASETIPTTTNYWKGYVKDFRITKGAALYPYFTPPTSALPKTGTVSTTNVLTTGILSLPELLQASYSPVRVSSASVGSRTSTDGTYTFYTFTSTSAQNITFSTGGLVDILLVGGGGGAGDTIGGGGGGGEVIVAKNIKVSAQQYNISVGAGGTAGTQNDGTNDAGNAGSSTTFSGAGFTTLTAVGGGGGAAGDAAGQVATAGANGGGGAFQTNQTGATGSGTTISAGTHGSSSTYSIYSGNSGGNGYINGGNTLHEGGGGAGAGSDGEDAKQLSGKSGGADGGSGVLVADFDGSYYYGGGGGGASYQYNSPGAGGAGGGGGGGTNSTTTNADQGLGDTQGRNNGDNGNAPAGSNTGFSDAFGGAGGANTGGGGGAGGYSGNSAAGAGGSGIVIVRITN
jgi:hypothetical protein